MSATDEANVSRFISKELEIVFDNTNFRLNGWGQVDNWCKISKNSYLFLEVETSQKHPNTNVLKLWPFLNDNLEIRIFLIQTFYPKSPGNKSNRGKLGSWTANQLKKIYKPRFEYEKIVLDGINDIVQLKEIKIKLKNFIQENNI